MARVEVVRAMNRVAPNITIPLSTVQGYTRRPRLLFLCQTLPFPPDGGVHIRSYNILRLLSQAFDVTALCFYRRATRPTPEHVNASIAGLKELADVDAFPIPQEHSRARLIWDHFRSVVIRVPYTRYVYESASFSKRLHSLLEREQFDLVHVDSLDLSMYLPALDGIPVVCTHHNIESDLLRRRARTESSPVMRRYLDLQAAFTENEERTWCSRVALNVVVSKGDGERLAAIAPGARITVVPNGVDTSMFKPAGDSGRGLVFVGGYSWYPNRDAMAYFGEEILPLVRQVHPDIEVTWVGRAPEDVKREYQSRYGIELTGYVDDVRPYVARASCCVVPIRVGGGTRLKILDAWAMGKAVVSTSIGCEGLEARDGENILIRDTPEAFAEGVNAILQDSALRMYLEQNSRATAEEIYDWRVIGESMITRYLQVLTRNPSAAR